uniref:Uncharacterized protein n=1 Tax=Ralstonia solanacearum TaxID=305 RepID=A0A0S4WRD3_RALSL|nr:protein of unknown function [Ralstonia solanacearum]
MEDTMKNSRAKVAALQILPIALIAPPFDSSAGAAGESVQQIHTQDV